MRIDNPNKVLINFIYHGEEKLPRDRNYIYVLHTPPSLVPLRYKYLSKQIIKFKNLRLVAVSRFIQIEASKCLNVKTIKVIYNGVDTKKFRIKPSEKSKKIINLITLSALEKRKGIHHVIRALKQLNNPNIIYKIYGEGIYKPELEQLIQSSKQEDRIFINPNTIYPEKCLNESDIFILLSKGEAFPFAPLEAMSCGLPIIVSDLPPYDEYVSKNIGLRVNRNSIKDVTDAIEYIIKKRKEFGINGRELIKTTFNWRTIANQYYEII